MTDTILTIRQVEDFFRTLTLQTLGLDPTTTANQSRVRIDWLEGGAPAWKIDDDVVFLMVTLDDDPFTQQVDVSYQEADANNTDYAMSYTRVFRISWAFYGPNSFDDADTLRSGLFLPQSMDSLSSNNLALIPAPNMPQRSPELFNGQWWERTSYYARFNELVVKHSDVPYIQTANVQVVKG